MKYLNVLLLAFLLFSCHNYSSNHNTLKSLETANKFNDLIFANINQLRVNNYMGEDMKENFDLYKSIARNYIIDDTSPELKIISDKLKSYVKHYATCDSVRLTSEDVMHYNYITHLEIKELIESEMHKFKK